MIARCLAATAILFLIGHVATAALYIPYDVDSLAVQASDIVEAELIQVDTRDEGKKTPAKIRITATYKGPFKPGETIPVRTLSGYRVMTEAGRRRTDTLPAGTKLFLFLAPPKYEEDGSPARPDDPKTRDVVRSGIRLIRGGKAVSFIQRSNPGPLVAADAKFLSNIEHPTLDEFRDRIATAIETSDEFVERFRGESTVEDVPDLLALLRKRAELPEEYGRDLLAEEACARLAELHHLEGLDEAAFLGNASLFTRSLIASGFACPDGREFLLERIGDEETSRERKLRYIQLMEYAGGDYGAVRRQISSRGHGISNDEPVSENGHYIERVAVLAGKQENDEELCLALLRAVWQFTRSSGGQTAERIHADKAAALARLKELHDETKSDRIKYEIEETTASADRAAYDRLNSPCGPILSQLRPVDPTKYSRPAGRSLVYLYTINDLVHDGDLPQPELILENIESGEATPLKPGERPFRSGHTGGSSVVSIPDDLPRGKYRVFLRFTGDDGRVISEGYGFETDL